MYQAQNINWLLRLSIEKSAIAEFSLLCKRAEYISRDTGWEEGASPGPRRTPLSFCFTHSRVESKGGRTETWKRRRKDAGAGRREIRQRAFDLHLDRHASWNSHSEKKKLFSTAPRLTALASALAAILHFTLALRFGR